MLSRMKNQIATMVAPMTPENKPSSNTEPSVIGARDGSGLLSGVAMCVSCRRTAAKPAARPGNAGNLARWSVRREGGKIVTHHEQRAEAGGPALKKGALETGRGVVPYHLTRTTRDRTDFPPNCSSAKY